MTATQIRIALEARNWHRDSLGNMLCTRDYLIKNAVTAKRNGLRIGDTVVREYRMVFKITSVRFEVLAAFVQPNGLRPWTKFGGTYFSRCYIDRGVLHLGTEMALSMRQKQAEMVGD